MENLIDEKILSHDEMKLLTGVEIQEYLLQLKEGWELSDNKIKKLFQFENFDKSMEFVNKVSDIAKKDNHHPDILIYFKKVEIVLSSHHVNGLSINDFIIATKIDLID